MDDKRHAKGVAALSVVALVSLMSAQSAGAQECRICDPTFPPDTSHDPGDAFFKIEDAFMKLEDLFHKYNLPSDPFLKIERNEERLRDDVFGKWL